MYDLDLSADNRGREFVGLKGLQKSNEGQKNVKDHTIAHEIMAPITKGDSAKFCSVRNP